MRFHKLTFFATIFFTIIMVLIGILCYYFFFQEIPKKTSIPLFSALVFLIIMPFFYFTLDYLLGFYGRKQMKKISNILPSDFISDDDNLLKFRELEEIMSEISQKNASEIDTMKEMETYRKEYLGNVSHELKTPLFSIQGYVEILIDGGIENLSIRDKYLDRIDKSVERLLNIVKDLDMISQYEMGEIKLHKSKFDINTVVKEIFDLLEMEAYKKDAKLFLQTNSNPIFVFADKQRISQVLINLLSNAIHYANRENAKVVVKTNFLINKVVIEVEDNGMGIKPEALPRIFERFFRVESSRNRKDGGSGLGLAIVKHILEAHNQNISVESIYLEGTKFTFILDKYK